jgi:hypothetical protein
MLGPMSVLAEPSPATPVPLEDTDESDRASDKRSDDQFLFRIPFLIFAAGVLAVTAARVGIGAFPNISLDLELVHTAPAVAQLPSNEQYNLYSPIGIVLAYLLGVATRSRWLLLHGAALACGLGAILLWCRWRHGDLAARFVAITWSSSTVPVIVLGWLGSYDVFTLVLSSALVVTESTAVSGLLGCALAFANFEQGVVVLATLAVLAAGRQFGRLSRVATASATLVIGRVALTLYLRANGSEADRLSYVSSFGRRSMIRMYLHSAPLIIATAFGAAALLVVATAMHEHLPRRDRMIWMTAFVPPFLVAMFGFDQTRVLALVSWPLLFALALTAAKDWPTRSIQRLGTAMMGLSLLVPAVYVWEGNLHAVGWANVVARLQGTAPQP